jgi:hypothetical protein
MNCEILKLTLARVETFTGRNRINLLEEIRRLSVFLPKLHEPNYFISDLTIISLSLSMVVEPFEPRPLFQILKPIHSRQDSMDGESARRKVATFSQNHTNTGYTHTHIHASSGIRTHDPSVGAGEDGSCLRARCHCDRG